MPDNLDCVVIGAGVTGLAIARALAISGRDVIVLEAGSAIGSETSSRNSEVIHAGLYYAPGSAKARFCEAGRRLLYDYCAERDVPHRRIGKLVVATSDRERGVLEEIARRAETNGADDLEFLDACSVHRLEPALTATAALLSPSTGILDSHSYMVSLQADAEAHGALFAFHTPVAGGEIDEKGVTLHIGGADPVTVHARHVVNAGGLYAHKIAASIDGMDPGALPTIRYAKGNYFGLAGKAPFSRLIYPVPEHGGLGVHLTYDLAGRARFGPDVEWVDEIDYAVDETRAEPFYAAVRRYWPDLPDGSLHPDYSGIRTKITGPDPSDFVIDTSTPGLVNLFGIESPGLTSSLAIANHVRALVD